MMIILILALIGFMIISQRSNKKMYTSLTKSLTLLREENDYLQYEYIKAEEREYNMLMRIKQLEVKLKVRDYTLHRLDAQRKEVS